MKKIKPYVISCLISLGVGGLAALLTADDMDIYKTLDTPPLSPPSMVFPIVWTVLYLLMGISAAAVWRQKRGRDVFESGLFVYALSLFVNFWWSILFFKLQYFLFSFLWLLLLWVLILMTVLAYRAVDRRSALLQLPYLAWVTFAGYLNLGVYLLNPR